MVKLSLAEARAATAPQRVTAALRCLALGQSAGCPAKSHTSSFI